MRRIVACPRAVLFNSYTFLLAFLPVALLGYVALGRAASHRSALCWAVLCSLVYYGWWKPAYLLLLLFSIAFNFGLGLPLARRAGTRAGRWLLGLGVAVDLGLLGCFKYAHFAVDTAAALTGASWQIGEILLPIGISFFTFQQVAYLVDAYRGKTREYRIVDYSLFVTFFPQLIAGPIVHHESVVPQFESGRRIDALDLSAGITIFVIGLAKKVLVADGVAQYATPVFQAADAGVPVGAAEAWLGTLSYTFQLYFDFSGYSDMAIGIARMFGILLPLNFDSPYKSGSIIEFWRRWHITLSRFLRDYLYVPLGGSRRGRARRYRNLMLTMLLGGLWHGAGWNFVLWGGLHGLLLCANHGWRRLRVEIGWEAEASSRWGRILCVGVTFLACAVGWIPFRAETLAGASGIVQAMLGLAPEPAAPTLPVLQAFGWVAALCLAVWLLPNTQEIMKDTGPALDPVEPSWSLVSLRWRPRTAWAVAIALAGVASLLQLSVASEFLYYQF